MIHHLILLSDHPDLHVQAGKLISGSNRIAVETLGSLQCFSAQSRWTQSALETLASQCPVVMSRWEKQSSKWRTFGLAPKARHVNPSAIWELCRISERRATQLASDLLLTKVRNQHAMLRTFDPWLADMPRLADNSFSRILRLEARYARFFWARYFAAVSQDLFEREKRKARSPLNLALNYGYGFLYHALEWQCLACGLETSVGLIHKLRRSRPSLACDLIEPLRCCVELTVARYLDEMHEKKAMSGRFAEMFESKWMYRGQQFRLRSIIRLYVESFVRALIEKEKFEPFRLHARDACL